MMISSRLSRGISHFSRPAWCLRNSSSSSTSQGAISVSRSADGIVTLKIDNLKRKNCLSFEMMKKLGDEIKAAATDDKCHGVIWTGEGDVFCSGLNLKDFADRTGIIQPGISPEEKLSRCKDLGKFVEGFVAALIDFPKPMIAYVNGPAIGIGVTALALCDMVIATEQASFYAPFSSLGFLIEACSSVTFPMLLGPLIANDVIVFGRKLSAEEGRQFGLVNHLIKGRENADKEVDKLARRVAKFPLGFYAAAKGLLRNTPVGLNREVLHRASLEEMTAMSKQWQTAEVSDAVNNFFNRRKN